MRKAGSKLKNKVYRLEANWKLNKKAESLGKLSLILIDFKKFGFLIFLKFDFSD